ncbi:ABC transporter ATP-binding protein [Streptomyces boninensis]|uniref:ABC transporter ATP-binding protein n=1 Tax=Streptomyces boninensis TaxID=2039455 RepID=UPI003B22648A
MTDPVLKVTDLEVGARGVPLVRKVSFQLARGERLGLVGESGSGKSLTSLAVMRLNTPPTAITGGSVLLGDRDLVRADEREMERVRGARVAMVYQDPMSSLNPVRTIGAQVAEAIRAHEDVPAKAAHARAVDLLGEVGVPDPAARARDYPHQFSGGMRQRVVIAMAIAASPEVLIADEPTTALDVTTQARILELLDRLIGELGMSVLFITHDLAVAAGFCDRLNVMYAGRVVESGPVADVFAAPEHPYTRALIDSNCTFALDPDQDIPAIGGQPPVAGALPAGCAFHPRCPLAEDACRVDDPLPLVPGPGRLIECHVAARRYEKGVAAL